MEKLSFEELVKKVLASEQRIEELASENADLRELIGTANATSITTGAVKKLPTIPKEEVEVGKKKYKFTHAIFHLTGHTEPITAETAATDPNILKEILAITGQKILKEVV